MSTTPTPIDPYAPPSVDAELRSGPVMPRMLKTIAIVAIVFGGIGVLKSLGTGVALVAGAQFQGMFMPDEEAMPEKAPDAQQAQRELQSEINAVTQKYLPWNIIRTVVHLGTALMLLVGGILALQSHGVGRVVLLYGALLAIVYELGNSAMDVYINLRLLPVVRRFADRLTEGPGNAGNPGEVAQGIMTAVLIGVTVIGVLFALMKIGLYAAATFYLGRESTANYFASEPFSDQ